MAVPILPIIKAVAPYLAQVATAAIPAFTAKNVPVAKQIEELQAAVTQNAQSIQVLAQKLQQTIEGLETAAQDARKQVAAYRAMLFISFGLSITSIFASLFLLTR